MTKTISTLALVSALTFGGAVARAGEAPQRGEVLVDGPSVKAVVVGPMAFHAYSGYSGGALYIAPAVTGTDADCQVKEAERDTTDLQADVVVTFSVPAGQVACLVTNRKLEVLWHARKDGPSPTVTDAPTTMMARR
jgi:hypothetical protein